MERHSSERSVHGVREHELVRRTRSDLANVDARIDQLAKEKAEMEERIRRGGPPELIPLAFERLLADGGVVVPLRSGVSVTVTPALRDRALTVLGQLIALLVSHRLRLWVHGGTTLVGRGEYAFALRLSEIAEKAGKASQLGYTTWIPTARLRITLRDGPGPDFRIADDNQTRIEEQLQRLVDYVTKWVARGPVKDRKLAEIRAVNARRSDEAEAAQLISARTKLALKLQAEMSSALEEDLRREARAWREASDLRDYASQVLASKPNDALVKAWAAWAMLTADAVDPTQRRLKQIVMGSASLEPDLDDG